MNPADCEHPELMDKIENKQMIPFIKSVQCQDCGRTFRPTLGDYDDTVYLRIDPKA